MQASVAGSLSQGTRPSVTVQIPKTPQRLGAIQLEYTQPGPEAQERQGSPTSLQLAPSKLSHEEEHRASFSGHSKRASLHGDLLKQLDVMLAGQALPQTPVSSSLTAAPQDHQQSKTGLRGAPEFLTNDSASTKLSKLANYCFHTLCNTI